MRCTLPTRMEKPNPKETINLLDLLSESESDGADLILAPQKKKKVKRRYRSRILSRSRHSNSCGCNKSDMRVISLWLAAVLITFWLIALSWLAAILYGEIKKMDMSIKSGGAVLLEMDSVAVTVPLRQPTKKMKKRKELDALAPAHAISRRSSGKRSSQELLTDSSDDRSEYWNISTRNGRKCRGRRSRACPGFLKACNAFLACASVLATASLIWLFIDVRQQLTALRTELDQVIAGSEGVPDALQKCHSLSRDLQNNQTIIFSRLSDLKQQINNFTVQLAHIQQDLHKVQEYFQAAPEMANLPKRLDELSSSVGTFGSQIRDLGATVNTLKETNLRVQDAQTTMQQNISSIKHTMLELSNITQKPQILSTNEMQVKTDKLNFTISHLMNNLTHVNETLSSKLQWVADDQDKDRKKLVSLQEATAAINTTMMSLQGECVKISEQASVLASIQQLTEKMSEIRTTDMELINKFKQLEQSYNGLKNSTSIMFTTVSEMQNQQQVNKLKLPESLNSDITTETDRGATDVGDIAQRKNDRSQMWQKRTFNEE